jgi:CRP/FNR family transcriptional regulator, cyclic AMP receptor protein
MSTTPSTADRAQTGVLAPELIAEFAKIGASRTFPKNTIVVLEGDPAETLYLVLDGELMVYVDDESGKLIELNRLGPGQYFGELMLGSAVRTASVKVTSTAKLCLIRRGEFEAIIATRPELAFHVIQTLIARVRALTEDVRGLALMDVYGRVARLLLENARDEDGRQVVHGLSQQAIGERVGASRSMISRILTDLEAGGYVALSRGNIELKRVLPKRW